MEKRLSLSDYLFTLIFIFMLVGAIAAFFYGMKIGKEKTAVKYEQLMKSQEEKAKGLTAYHQQHLVSFYHTIYLPYRDFQKKWFEHMEAIELRGNSVDAASMFKELAKLADNKYKEAVDLSMPSTSPLLQEAQRDYLKSLKLFANASERIQEKTESLKGIELIVQVENDAYFQEAKNFALLAQKEYHRAIVKWHEAVDPNLEGIPYLAKNDVSVKEWMPLHLTIKNSLISAQIVNGKYFRTFYPQDLTIRVDELIDSGQAQKMKLTTIGDIVEMMVNTGAVRQGDFIKSKNKYYNSEVLPQLPFFFEKN